MQHRLLRFHVFTHRWRHILSEEFISVLLALLVFVSPVAASTRFDPRSLFMQSNEPGVKTSYTISFRYMTPVIIGSVDMLFCNSPVPSDPCFPPTGLDASQAILTGQSGETGFSIQAETPNHIVLTRLPQMITASDVSSYTLSNIKNPTDSSQAFSIRLRSHSSTDASGQQIDFGSVRGQVNGGILLETQVPPMLVFCLAEQVDYGCTGTNDNYYTDMGDLNASSTLKAQSQMAVGTNASGGFAITANGTPLAAGTNVIDSPKSPTASKPGTNQFGINLVENSDPGVGANPEGVFANAIASPGYDQPNKYKYVSGDVVAFSPNVSLMKKFTVSYIVNSAPDLHAGIYTTTINYIASGRF